jgi:hypothetical protein
VLNETSKAYVGPSAQINVGGVNPNADQGVNIHATNDTRVQSGAGGIGGGGAAGVGAGIDVGVITKNTEAYIANASTTTSYFGPTAVNTTNNTINLGYNDGFTTGEPVVYNNGGGTGIGIRNPGGSTGTLQSGTAIYYVIVVNSQTIKLAATENDATSGNAITLTSNGTSLTQSFQTVNVGQSGPTFGASQVITSGQANSINTVLPTGYSSGQPVVYNDGGGTDIGGLVSGALYYAIVNPSNSSQIQLAATPGGPAITLTSRGTSLGQNIQSATLSANPYSFAASAVITSSAGNTITTAAPSGFTTGKALVYNDGGGTPIGGLQSGQIYYAIAVPSQPNLISLAGTAAAAAAGNVITLTSSGTGTLAPITLGATSATFGPSSVTYYSGDATDNSINLGPNNPFQTGNPVVYNDGGGTDIRGLTDGTVYYAIVNSANPTLLQLADSAADAAAGNVLPLFSPGSSSTQSFQAVTISSGVSLAGVTPASTANTINLGASSSVQPGDALLYTDGGGTDIGGLQNGHVYYAIVTPTNPGLVRLADSPADAAVGNAIPLTSSGTSSSQRLTPITLGAGNVFGPSNVITAADTSTINTATPVGFSSGQAVVYDAGDGTPIGGLQNGQVYYAVVGTSQPNRLQLAATPSDAMAGRAIMLSSAGSSSTQQFTAITIAPAGAASPKAVVRAAGDVSVQADSRESVISVSAAGAGGAAAGVAGAVGSYTLNITTLAFIGSGDNVFADGNVLVASNDTDGVSMLAGTVTGKVQDYNDASR